MPVTKMRALKTFRGRPGEAVDGGSKVRQNTEIKVVSPRRAQDLERSGLAVPLGSEKDNPRVGSAKTTTAQIAGQDGPLLSAGGATGEASAPQSSRAARQQARSTSPSSRAKRK